ncbi:N-acetylmuramidase domain-containing protein [Halomonas mongoliensis]|uniref:N-acetylmuramidase domain-containing protein n=1 Tax=Halomonas mongoliensis TaxID=321265 RepID=UPI00403A85E1
MSDWYSEVDFVPRRDLVLRRGDSGDEVRALQQRLNAAGFSLTVDGQFGPLTEQAVRAIQKRSGLVVDGLAGPKTEAVLDEARQEDSDQHGYRSNPRPPDDRLLGQRDLEWAADELKVPVAAIMAVNEVESRGSGFFSNGRPAILFERHIMARRLRHHGIDPIPYCTRHPDLVNTRWGGYIGGIREYERLARAQRIHETSALESASWGLFQIMGFHWQHLGYTSVQHYVELMHRSERDHLEAFVRFIRRDTMLLSSLRNQEWARFARRYNGPSYEKNRYDLKMAQAFERHRHGLRESGMLA